MTPFFWTGLYFGTLISFLPPLTLAFRHDRRNHAPLARKFLVANLGLASFLVTMAFSYSFFMAAPDLANRIEQFFDTLCFTLYGLMAVGFAAWGAELLQHPWGGWGRLIVLGYAGLGVLLPLTLHAVIWDPLPRLEAVRLAVNGVYLPIFLVGLSGLFATFLIRRPRVTDPWKRTTLRGAASIFFLGLPLFVIDAAWPWFQVEWGLLPRGANLHLLVFLAWNAFFTWRWWVFQPQALDQVPLMAEDPVVLATLSLREREVAQRLLDGRSNQDIASSLGITVGTVKALVYRIYNKTGASSRKELIRMCAV